MRCDEELPSSFSVNMSKSVLETVNLFRASRRLRFLFKLLVTVDVELIQPVSSYDIVEIDSSGFSQEGLALFVESIRQLRSKQLCSSLDEVARKTKYSLAETHD